MENRLVYVTLIRHMVAVADNRVDAIRQNTEMLQAMTERAISNADEHGEAREAVKIRICKVRINL